MAEFPTTTEELEEYISDYMDAHIAEHLEAVSNEQIAQAIAAYMQTYGAAIEDNGTNGDVPLIPDGELDANNSSIPMARLSNGVPASFFQARVRALALVAAHLITHADVPMAIVPQTETDVEINPNVLNVWGSVEALEIALTGDTEGQVNEYMLQFVVDGDDFELTLPSGVRWLEEIEFESGNTYQVSIVNNLAVGAGWEAASA